jgi:hypothetical protein
MREIDWAGVLDAEDVEALWSGLFHLVSRHPAVRPLHFATDGAAVMSQAEINADLTQELFLELFQKQRFEHYIENNYTSGEIENELARIELPNLVGARLRKRYPESFRLARRVSALLKSSSRFKRFGAGSESRVASSARRGRPSKKAPGLAGEAALQVDYIDDDDDSDSLPDDDQAGAKKNGKSEGPRRQRMVNQIFGLKEWPRAKPLRDSGHFAELAKSVAMAKRDTRLVGRSGTSQLILSNPDLEKLIVEVLKAIDSPADVRTLRQLVLSKIPLQDYNVSSLDQEMTVDENGSAIRREARDTRDTPEDAILRGEQDERVVLMADEFLSSLRHAVNNNDRRYVRLLSTLWHCYYDPQEPSQLEIARLLGVSDSLVSDNRRLIEYELKKLRLSVEEGAVFSEALRLRVVQDQSPSPG